MAKRKASLKDERALRCAAGARASLFTPLRSRTTEADDRAMRSSDEIVGAMGSHGDSVWRSSCLYLRRKADAEDAYQETFLRLARADDVVFNGAEHMKAWLLRTNANICKDMLKAAEARCSALDPDGAYESLDPYLSPGSELAMIADAMNKLDESMRTPLYLALVEGYAAAEISQMTGVPKNTVYSRISRGKKLLREALK